ncbi:S-layer homology domain-containing protein [Oscillospiraceae bacterium OttesenSCG-928-G22]|nr:S-layer homology domain-containing protein [Oscillospiraceae bacterium OttesenSCG-928-G22]
MKRKLLSIFLSLCMILLLFPMSAMAQNGAFTDTADHWAEGAIEAWAARGVLKGSDGLFRPNDPITRAELAAVLNRVIGYTAVTNTAFADVPSDAWYHGDVARLYAAGIMQGDGTGVMRPTANITREEAVVLIARAFNVEENAGNENPFPDASDISGWASFLVDGMKAKNYISGDTSGKFNPRTSITRAEVATILSNMIALSFDKAGEHDYGEAGGANAVISAAGVTIKNMSITGDLWITEGVGTGDVTLDGVSVVGTTYIRGGGPNSIHVIGGSFSEFRLDATTAPALKLSRETEVGRIYLDSTGTITHGGVTISYDESAGLLTFAGTIDKVEIGADGSAIVTIGDRVYDVPAGKIEKLNLSAGSEIKEMILGDGVAIDGAGKIDKMEIYENGVLIGASVKVAPANIVAEKGVALTIGDKAYAGTGDGVTTGTVVSGGGGGGTSSTTVSVTGVSLDKSTLSITVGASDSLTATVEPLNATTKSVTWASDDDTIATVSDGVVTAIGVGNTTITVTTTDGAKIATCAVTVTPCPHTNTTQKSDAVQHWTQCDDCQEIALAKENHVSDGAQVTNCEAPNTCTVCATVIDEAGTHASDGAQASDCEAANTCTKCGVEIDAAGTHTAPVDADCAAGYNCDICGTAVDAGVHTSDGAQATNCEAPNTCTVCATILDGAGTHISDDAQATNCEAPNACTVCATILDGAGTHIWLNGTCNVCDTVCEKELDHEYNFVDCVTDGTCDICGYVTEAPGHTSDDMQYSDCEAPNACTVCDTIIDEAGTHDWQNGVCNVCDTVCEKELDHEYNYVDCVTDGTCDICGYVTVAPGHESNDAQNDDCEALNICMWCGTTMDEAGTHDWSSKSGTCDVCGTVCEKEFDHEYNFVDCVTDAECDICGYVTVAPGHISDDMQDTDCEAPNTCIVCDTIIDEASTHDWQNGTCNFCDTVCEKYDSHNFVDCVTDGECNICGYVTEAPGHDSNYAQDDDCEAPNTCIVCDTIIDEAGTHDWSSKSGTCDVCGTVCPDTGTHETGVECNTCHHTP